MLNNKSVKNNTEDYISNYLDRDHLLAQAAEECSELAQACLKLIRVYDKVNPTTVSEEDAINNLAEEAADVLLCVSVLVESGLISPEAIESYQIAKYERWLKRLENKENEENGK
jgi:NTP pyrophosphatase (non-canonical NTP hydrolase)